MLDLMLRDRLVCGVNDDAIQRRLLADQNLMFEKALATAQSLEAAAQNMKELHQESQQDEVEQGEVHKVRVSTPHESGSSSEKEKLVHSALQVTTQLSMLSPVAGRVQLDTGVPWPTKTLCYALLERYV